MKVRRLVVSVAMIALAATAEGGVLPRTLPRIVNGTLDWQHPTTGALLRSTNSTRTDAFFECSGTLIGCQTFLTAKHCVVNGAGDAIPASQFFVYLQHGGIHHATTIHRDPNADLALVVLGSPVDAISPTPINQASVPQGTSGTIVGFGLPDGFSSAYGLKRRGMVTVTYAGCPPGEICWLFDDPLGPPGYDSDTCYGDSGGPLFVQSGITDVVAGVTTSGTNPDCATPDLSDDQDVSANQSWILSTGGADLANTVCGYGVMVNQPTTTVHGYSGFLDATTTSAVIQDYVPTFMHGYRIGMNGEDNGATNFNMYVKFGSAPTTTSYDCASTGSTQFQYCDLDGSAPGYWYVLVKRVKGSGAFQLAATQIPSPQCGNGIREGYEQCDRGPYDTTDCCTSSCTFEPVGKVCGGGCGRTCDASGVCR